jgi:hypothetical protein
MLSLSSVLHDLLFICSICSLVSVICLALIRLLYSSWPYALSVKMKGSICSLVKGEFVPPIFSPKGRDLLLVCKRK